MNGDKFSSELRLLLAFALSVVAMLIMQRWMARRFPPPPAKAPTTMTQPVVPAPIESGPAKPQLSASPRSVGKAAPVEVKAATAEQEIVAENTLYRVVFSNRGAVVKSWILKKYADESGSPLDVVHPAASSQVGFPLRLVLGESGGVEVAALQKEANEALFVGPASEKVSIPGTLAFEYAGKSGLGVEKRFRFDESYVVQLETIVTLNGALLAHSISWQGGFGDRTAFQALEQVQVFRRGPNEVQRLAHKKVSAPKSEVGSFAYAGIEDLYFAAVFLPPPGAVRVTEWKDEFEPAPAKPGEKASKQPALGIALGVAGGGEGGPDRIGAGAPPAAQSLGLFVGPKDLDALAAVKPPLSELVDFGWFAVIAKPLFLGIKWLYHNVVANYGWAIVIMTIVINMALFPLKLKGMQSAQKMQKAAPEVRSIQDRYKKFKFNDPRKQEMQKEIMAVYKKQGINPVGGCLPMLLQIPFLYAFYKVLAITIEMRHARWLGWIKDLSARDPYYVLPILMAVTMYLLQKMTPTATADPAQQRMMKMMPLMLGGMFVVFPVSSGLMLYWLVGNIIGMGQQWFINRLGAKEAERDAQKRRGRPSR